jgi:hypothetical protein
MCGGNKGQSSSNSTTTQTPAAMGEYQMLMQRLNQVGSQPYVPYGGQLVADLSPYQQKGIEEMANAYGSAQPFINQAADYARMGASPIQQSAIQNYLNPYQNQVVNATMGELENVQQANNTQAMGSTLGGGGLFNDRAGVMQGQLANQEAIANAQTLGQLNTANYNQALGAAQADRSAAAQGAYTFGNLGAENLQTLLQGAQGTLSAGQLQQQQQQALLNSLYGQWQQQQAFPYQQLSWMAGLGTGIGSQMGGTSNTAGTQTPAQPNPWNQWGGLGLAALSMFAKDGGRVDGYADGGAPDEQQQAPAGISMPFGSSVPFASGHPSSSPFGGGSSYIPSGISMPNSPWSMHTPGQQGGQGGGQKEKSLQDWEKTFAQAGKGMKGLYDKWNTDSSDTSVEGSDGEGGTPTDSVSAPPASQTFDPTGGISPETGEAAPMSTSALDFGGDTAMAGDFGSVGDALAFVKRGGGIPIHGFAKGFAEGGAPDDDLEGGFSPDIGAFSPTPGMDAPAGFDRGAFADRFSPAEDLPAAGPMKDSPLAGAPAGSYKGDRLPRIEPAPALPPPVTLGNAPRVADDILQPHETSGAIPSPTPSPRRDFGRLEHEAARADAAGDHEKSNAIRNALLTAGLSLMASRSPWFGSALGEAGLSGLSAYAGTQASEKAERLTQQKLEEGKAKLAQAQTLAERKQGLAESIPRRIGTDQEGNPLFGTFNPKSGRYEPMTGGPMSGGAPLQPQTVPSALPPGMTQPAYDRAVGAIPDGLAGPNPNQFRNDDYLRTLSAEDQDIVKALVDYRLMPGDLSIRGNRREKVLAEANRYDPSYDSTLAPAKKRAMIEFYSGGNTSPAGIMLNGNTSLMHLGEMSDALEEYKKVANQSLSGRLGAAGIPFASYYSNEWYRHAIRGTPEEAALQKFMTARQKYVDEVTKFYAGGQGTQAEREAALHIVDPSLSIEGLRTTLGQDSRLMADKVTALQHRLMQGMGPTAWRNALVQDPRSVLIYQQGREAIDRIEARERAGSGPAPGGPPAPGGGAPAAPAAGPRAAAPAPAAAPAATPTATGAVLKRPPGVGPDAQFSQKTGLWWTRDGHAYKPDGTAVQ